MAQYTSLRRLSRTEQNELLLELCDALVAVKVGEEAAQFLRDLLTPNELKMIARRLKIAKELMRGEKYDTIMKQWKAAPNTIARIQAWLEAYGEGFRLVAARTTERPLAKAQERYLSATTASGGWKRRSPLYFWPELLLAEIIKAASKRKKEKLWKTLSTVREAGVKTKLFRDLEHLLRSSGTV
ncbi:hypothetical protein HY629_01680 [Candidatus Uhrbacteria bacterium]|nr:hypothetical protein [Candidatus Uhrbacteria bacterium]